MVALFELKSPFFETGGLKYLWLKVLTPRLGLYMQPHEWRECLILSKNVRLSKLFFKFKFKIIVFVATVSTTGTVIPNIENEISYQL